MPAWPVAAGIDSSPEALPDWWAGDVAAWLPRARRCWQTGDWEALASLAERSLQRHPERARLALLAAAGRFQMGDAAATRRCVEQALDWGCDRRLVGQMFVSGLHNTIGRAATLLDDPARALTHFAAAIATGSPGSSLGRITQARGGSQLAQLGLGNSDEQPALAADAAPSKAEAAKPAATAEPPPILRSLRRVAIGRLTAGWPTEEMHPQVLSERELQFAVYRSGPSVLRIVRRHGDTCVQRELAIDAKVGRAAFCLGMDASGHLHLCHVDSAGRLQHRMTTEPRAVKQWSRTWLVPMPDRKDAQYCQLLASASGTPLLLVVQSRGDRSGEGALDLMAWDQDRLGWQLLPAPPVLAGASGWVHLVNDSLGALHLLASASPGGEGLRIDHAFSLDGGVSWEITRPPRLAGVGESKLQVAAGAELHVLCQASAESQGRAPWHLRFAHRTWQADRLASDVAVGRPQWVVPAGLGCKGRAGLLDCSAASGHRVLFTALQYPQAAPRSPDLNLLACRAESLAVAKCAEGVTLLVREHGSSALEERDSLALYDFAWS